MRCWGSNPGLEHTRQTVYQPGHLSGSGWWHLTRRWALGAHIASEGDIGGSPRLQGDGVGVEVSKHIKHRLEPQMLDVALAVTIQRQTKMLRVQMGMVSGESRASYLYGTLGVVGRLCVGPIGTIWYSAMLGALTLSPVWGRSFSW